MWNQIQFISGNDTVTERLEDYTYRSFERAGLRRYLLEKISRSPRLHLVNDMAIEVKSLCKKETLCIEIASGNSYRSEIVFDSSQGNYRKQLEAYREELLCQYTEGWLIHTEEEVFNTEVATIMDFRIGRENLFEFGYLLPLDQSRAFIEVVSTDASINLRKMGERYIEKRLGIRDYSMQTIEKGRIPMVLSGRLGSETGGLNHIKIGAAAGMIKPSTGYMIPRSLRAVENFLQNRNLSMTNILYEYADRTLLSILSARKENLHVIFTDLLRKMGGDALFRFLNEEASAGDFVKLVSSVPRFKFLKYLLRELLL
jgi:lycopene beta-cyclase